MNNKNDTYHLCLWYSSKVHPRIIEKDFNSFYEIDIITMKFENENDLRKNKHYNNEISRCQRNMSLSYFSNIKDKNRINGDIYIVKHNDNGEFTYIRPLYKSTAENIYPKKLIGSIISKLKEENNNSLMRNFLNRYKHVFNNDFAGVRGFYKLKNNIYQYKSKEVISKYNQEDYDKLLKIIKEVLDLRYNSEKKSLKEKDQILYRSMQDYLDDRIREIHEFKEKNLYNNYTQNNELSKNISEENNNEYDESLITFDDLPKLIEEFNREEEKKNNTQDIINKKYPVIYPDGTYIINSNDFEGEDYLVEANQITFDQLISQNTNSKKGTRLK